MALTATVHVLAVDLADTDRGVYENFDLRVARHPSETAGFMLARVLAYCLEYTEGIAFTDGVSAEDEPAVVVRDLTGRITRWIEIGAPDAERLHRGSRLAGTVVVYTHRDPAVLLRQLTGERIHRAEALRVVAFARGFVDRVAEHLARRARLGVAVTGGHLYLELDGVTFDSPILEHHLG